MNDAGLLKCTLSAWQGDPGRCRWCNTELTGRQQRWCGDACPREMINNHWMRSARIAVFNRDGGCVRCPTKVGLVAHHRDEYAKGRHSQSSCCHHIHNLETLCEPCHIAEHRRRPVPRRRYSFKAPSERLARFVPSRAPARARVHPHLYPRDIAILTRLTERPSLASELGVTGGSLKHLSSAGLAWNELGLWRPTAYGRERLAAVQACEEPPSSEAVA